MDKGKYIVAVQALAISEFRLKGIDDVFFHEFDLLQLLEDCVEGEFPLMG